MRALPNCRMARARWWAAAWLAALCICPPLRAEEVVVIVSKDNVNLVDAGFVLRVYTGTLKGWPDGTPVLVLDQPEDSDAHEVFCTAVLRRSVHNVKAIWSQNIFTGKGLPPKITSPDAAMKRAVAANRQAIGFIRLSQVDDTVRVVGR